MPHFSLVHEKQLAYTALALCPSMDVLAYAAADGAIHLLVRVLGRSDARQSIIAELGARRQPCIIIAPPSVFRRLPALFFCAALAYMAAHRRRAAADSGRHREAALVA